MTLKGPVNYTYVGSTFFIPWLTLLLSFFLTKQVSAQDTLRQDTLRVSYSINATGSFKQGRLNQTILSLEGDIKLEKEKWDVDLSTSYKYLKTNGIVGENELFGKAMISLIPKKRFYPVLGNLFFKSEFYQIVSRNNPGVGAAYGLLKGVKNNITISCWLAYDKTVFENIPTYETFRLNGFLSGNYELIKNKLNSRFVFYYLHSLEENLNFIWRIEPSLIYSLSEKFSLSLNYRNHFENVIDPSNEKQNSALTIGVKFQNN